MQKEIYIVIYSDYDQYIILGYFNDKETAEKYKKYREKFIGEPTYGEAIDINTVTFLGDIDIDAKILEYEENKKKKLEAELEAIKQSEIAEYNRIKEKYGL